MRIIPKTITDIPTLIIHQKDMGIIRHLTGMGEISKYTGDFSNETEETGATSVETEMGKVPNMTGLTQAVDIQDERFAQLQKAKDNANSLNKLDDSVYSDDAGAIKEYMAAREHQQPLAQMKPPTDEDKQKFLEELKKQSEIDLSLDGKM